MSAVSVRKCLNLLNCHQPYSDLCSSVVDLIKLSLTICLVFMLAQPSGQERGKAASYLHKYGYLGPDPAKVTNIPPETLTEAVREFQAFFGLNITGQLDNSTLDTMDLPRCGVKDKENTDSRRKRYVVQGTRWQSRNITYRITKYSEQLSAAIVDEEIRKAFKLWSRITPLIFSMKQKGTVDIELRFERGEHGNEKESSFEGRGGALAHAFYPGFGGDVHFDDDEEWSTTDDGINLFQVATHEIGHSLGLAHSDVECSVMAPTYTYSEDFALDIDDIEGIQAIYGHRHTRYHHFHVNHSYDYIHGDYDTTDNDICGDDNSIDTIFETEAGDTYVFKGDKCWKLNENLMSKDSPTPKLIKDVWHGLPDNIDAAFTYKNKRTYFFKGSQYWRFKGFQMDSGYPKSISETFSGIPNNIDAAMVWGGNGKVYFFKGPYFWCFDPKSSPLVKTIYPKPVTNWKGIPDHIDAAFTSANGLTYFFKDGLYYRFNNDDFCVDFANPPYPRLTRLWWFNC